MEGHWEYLVGWERERGAIEGLGETSPTTLYFRQVDILLQFLRCITLVERNLGVDQATSFFLCRIDVLLS